MRIILLLGFLSLLGSGCLSPDLNLDEDEPSPTEEGRRSRGLPTAVTPTQAVPTPSVPVPTPTAESMEPEANTTDDQGNSTGNFTIRLPPHEPVIHLVSIFAKDGGFTYKPDPTNITLSDSLRWRNESHVAHAFTIKGEFFQETLYDGEVFDWTPSAPGNYTMECYFHPKAMDRTFHVEPDPNAQPAEA